MARCDAAVKTNEELSASAGHPELAQCLDTPQATVRNSSSQPAATLGVSTTGPELSSTDPLLGLRRAILSGTGLPQLASPVNLKNDGFFWPVVGPITQPFGVPELGVGSPHTGLDIGQDPGNPVRAAQSGRVTISGGDPCCGLGYWIEVNHGNAYSTGYGHLLRPPLFLRGDYVNQGQVLGFSGNTGFSTGPHLHFEIRINGVPVDPLRALPSR